MLERLEYLIARARSEYMEMPVQRLSVTEAGRLWGIEHDLAETILQALVDHGFELVMELRASHRQSSGCASSTGKTSSQGRETGVPR